MKKEMKKVIADALFRAGRPTPMVFQEDLDVILDRVAQAIIDRLEIDLNKMINVLWNELPGGLQYAVRLAKIVVKAKPIKLKAGDKQCQTIK